MYRHSTYQYAEKRCMFSKKIVIWIYVVHFYAMNLIFMLPTSTNRSNIIDSWTVNNTVHSEQKSSAVRRSEQMFLHIIDSICAPMFPFDHYNLPNLWYMIQWLVTSNTGKWSRTIGNTEQNEIIIKHLQSKREREKKLNIIGFRLQTNMALQCFVQIATVWHLIVVWTH